jgi:hypothetical protein
MLDQTGWRGTRLLLAPACLLQHEQVAGVIAKLTTIRQGPAPTFTSQSLSHPLSICIPWKPLMLKVKHLRQKDMEMDELMWMFVPVPARVSEVEYRTAAR